MKTDKITKERKILVKRVKNEKILMLGVLTALLFKGFQSITAKGKLGSIQNSDSDNYKSNKSNGNKLGHKNPKNPNCNTWF
jgi:hypothetical protein